MRQNPPVLIAVLAVSLAVATASCSKEKAPAPSGPVSTPPVTAALAVAGVDLGRSVGGDKRITENVETFRPNDTIYASIHTTGSAPRATLKARWTYEDGQVVDESEQAISPSGATATEFHISKPDGWPIGKYRLEVFLDGRPVQTKEFEVQAA